MSRSVAETYKYWELCENPKQSEGSWCEEESADGEGALPELGPCPHDNSCVGCRGTELGTSKFCRVESEDVGCCDCLSVTHRLLTQDQNLVTSFLKSVHVLFVIPVSIDSIITGVASCGALGHVPPRISTVWLFRSLQSSTNSGILLHLVVHPVNNSAAYSAYSATSAPQLLSLLIAWISYYFVCCPKIIFSYFLAPSQ